MTGLFANEFAHAAPVGATSVAKSRTHLIRIFQPNLHLFCKQSRLYSQVT